MRGYWAKGNEPAGAQELLKEADTILAGSVCSAVEFLDSGSMFQVCPRVFSNPIRTT